MVCPTKRSDLIKEIYENIKSIEIEIITPLTSEKVKSVVAKALTDLKMSLESQKGFLDTLRAKRFKLIQFFVWIADSIQKRKISNEINKIEAFLTANQLVVPASTNIAHKKGTHTPHDAQPEAKLQNKSEQELSPRQQEEEIKKRREKAKAKLLEFTGKTLKLRNANHTLPTGARASAPVVVNAQQQKTNPPVGAVVAHEPRFPTYYFDEKVYTATEAGVLWSENIEILNGKALDKHFEAAGVLMENLGLPNKFLVWLRVKFLDAKTNYDQSKVDAIVDAINIKIKQRNVNALEFLNSADTKYYYYAVSELLPNPSLEYNNLILMKSKVEDAMENEQDTAEGNWLLLEINKRLLNAHK